MNSEEYVIAVHKYVASGAVRDTTEVLASPNGRNPPKESVQRSERFNALPIEAKQMCEIAASEAVDAALFGLFCVLDGVRNIDEMIDASRLRLVLETESEEIVLSDNTEFLGLHDIYNSICK